MKLINQHILLISPESWDHIQISKHHYAIELAKKNNKVFFLGPPADDYSIEKTSYSSVYKVGYKGFPKGLRFYPKVLRKLFQNRVIKKLENLADCRFNIIWSFDNSVFTDFNTDQYLCISHIVDFSQDFSFERAAKNADINLAVSENIREKQLKYNIHSYKIGHALDDMFLDHSFMKKQCELPGKNRIKALTIGNLKSAYIDWNLAISVYEHFKNIDFVHIGPYGNEKIEKDNVFFIGAKNKSELPGLMQSADFLFIFYDYEKHKDQLTNSHKILEFLSSGKALVCNKFSDYEEVDLLYQCANPEDYFRAIHKVIDKKEDSELVKKRQTFASQKTYGRRLQEIEDIIAQVIDKKSLN